MPTLSSRNLLTRQSLKSLITYVGQLSCLGKLSHKKRVLTKSWLPLHYCLFCTCEDSKEDNIIRCQKTSRRYLPYHSFYNHITKKLLKFVDHINLKLAYQYRSMKNTLVIPRIFIFLYRSFLVRPTGLIYIQFGFQQVSLKFHNSN